MGCGDALEVLVCETAENVGALVDVINDNFDLVEECLDELSARPLLIPPPGLSIRGQYTGLDISMNSVDPINDTDSAPGSCLDSTGTVLGTSSTTITKQLDVAWAPGDAAGGLLNGVKSVNTAYRWFALIKLDDLTLDFAYLEDGDDIATYVPVGYSYRLLKYVHTNGAGEICLYSNIADVLTFYIASESRIEQLTTGFATVDHSSIMPVDMIKGILYGFSTASTTDRGEASKDGTNVAYALGAGNSINDTNIDVWGYNHYHSQALKTFDENMQFKTTSGTAYLLASTVLLDV